MGSIDRRRFVSTSVEPDASALAAPALIGRASAAIQERRLSSSQANIPKFASGCAYDVGSRSVLSGKAVDAPDDLVGPKNCTLPNPVVTEYPSR